MLFLKLDAYDLKTGRTRKAYVNANHICNMFTHIHPTPPMKGTLLMVVVAPGTIMVKNSIEDIEKALKEKGYLFEVPTMVDEATLNGGQHSAIQIP